MLPRMPDLRLSSMVPKDIKRNEDRNIQEYTAVGSEIRVVGIW